MKLLNDYIRNFQIPLINAIFYPNGKILIIDSYYVGEKYIIQLLCESSIDSFFTYNEPNEVSNFDVYYKADYGKYRTMCGEGSYGSDGIIYTLDVTESKLLWAIYLNNSNPFNKINYIDEKIIVYSTKGFKLIIPFESPEKLLVED